MLLSACTSGELMEGGLCANPALIVSNSKMIKESDIFIFDLLLKKQLCGFCQIGFHIHPGMTTTSNKTFVLYPFGREVIQKFGSVLVEEVLRSDTHPQ